MSSEGFRLQQSQPETTELTLFVLAFLLLFLRAFSFLMVGYNSSHNPFAPGSHEPHSTKDAVS